MCCLSIQPTIKEFVITDCAVQPPAWHLCAPFPTLLRERNNNTDLDTPGQTYLKLKELDSEI